MHCITHVQVPYEAIQNQQKGYLGLLIVSLPLAACCPTLSARCRPTACQTAQGCRSPVGEPRSSVSQCGVAALWRSTHCELKPALAGCGVLLWTDWEQWRVPLYMALGGYQASRSLRCEVVGWWGAGAAVGGGGGCVGMYRSCSSRSGPPEAGGRAICKLTVMILSGHVCGVTAAPQ